MVNMKLHLNSPRNWADWDQCNVENSRIAKIQGYLRPKDMPGPRMWSKYARYLCIACQCWQRQSPHRVIFIRQTRPIVPSFSWLTWTAGHISWIAKITTEKMFHSIQLGVGEQTQSFRWVCWSLFRCVGFFHRNIECSNLEMRPHVHL